MERYKNNIDSIFTEQIQELLLTKNIAVIGCGGQGGYILEFLVRLGVNSIAFWDGDYYEESNLNRQIGCLSSTLNKNKAEALEERLKDINSNIKLICYNWFFGDNENDEKEILNYDLIFYAADCNYNIITLRKILRKAILFNIPIIDCPVNMLGGYVCIETKNDLNHFDFMTNELIRQNNEKKFFNKEELVSQTAYKCALIAAEAVNQMVQYFSNIRYACTDSVLNIDLYHHKYSQQDKFGEF